MHAGQDALVDHRDGAARQFVIGRDDQTRLQTQSKPPDHEGSQGHGGGEVGGELVVTSGDAAPILEPAEHALNQVAQLVGLRIEGMEVLAGRIVRNDRLGAALDQEPPERIAVIRGIGGAQTACWQRLNQAAGDWCVAALARGYLERDGTAATIDNSMDLCRSPAARAADRLELGPPFPPPAERCAFAVVLSIIWTPPGSTATSAANKPRQIPRAAQR